MTRPFLTLLIATGWLLLITVLLCIPGKEFPKSGWMDMIWFDKWVHAGLFFLLVLAWCRVIRSIDSSFPIKMIRLTAFAVLVYGISMEIVQEYFIPYRSFEISDILSDGAGCLAAYFYIIWKWKRK